MRYSDKLGTSLLIQGDATHAYRDPAVYYDGKQFHLWCTLVETETSGEVYMYVVSMTSDDLVNWSEPVKLTPRDQSKNFSSPGNIVRADDRWVLCLQTYCRENGEKYGNENSRLYVMESDDLEHWSHPRGLEVKGKEVGLAGCGRMIDPYLIQRDGKWICFYKQNGISYSQSDDLYDWTFIGKTDAGENPSIVETEDGYYLYSSPHNGISVMRSSDLMHWEDVDYLTLGQDNWTWAKGRITAATVIRAEDEWLMFFHGTGPEDEQTIFDTHACIGVAWSNDLKHWNWK